MYGDARYMRPLLIGERGFKEFTVQPCADIARFPSCLGTVRMIGHAVDAVFAEQQCPVILDFKHYPLKRFKAVFGDVILLESAVNRAAACDAYGSECSCACNCGKMPRVLIIRNGFQALIRPGILTLMEQFHAHIILQRRDNILYCQYRSDCAEYQNCKQ